MLVGSSLTWKRLPPCLHPFSLYDFLRAPELDWQAGVAPILADIQCSWKHVVLGVKQEGGSFIIYPYKSILSTVPPSTISFSNQRSQETEHRSSAWEAVRNWILEEEDTTFTREKKHHSGMPKEKDSEIGKTPGFPYFIIIGVINIYHFGLNKLVRLNYLLIFCLWINYEWSWNASFHFIYGEFS